MCVLKDASIQTPCSYPIHLPRAQLCGVVVVLVSVNPNSQEKRNVMLSMFCAVALMGAGGLPAATAPASTANVVVADRFNQADFDMQIISDTEIIIDGHTYNSWDAVANSGYYHQESTKCGIDPLVFQAIDQVEIAGSPTDCSFSTTNPAPEYDPSVEKYRIPVVVHVIQRTNGTGAMTDARVQSQIDILNEDFLAIAGTNGAPGTDSQIEFYLAEIDPDGNPTTGITRSTNNTWFNDGGSYWNSLAWDTNRYLNIYTNNASGALGYVPDLPQGGIAGSNSDRVVVLYSTFGRNAPFSPYNLGRTGTHEVGHYLGLYHTFTGGCAGGNCYTRGDRICDTNDESSPTFGCPNSRTSCGSQAPLDNYMDYSDDRCMEKFTPEQANRMRCSLINYRPDLYQLATGPCSAADIVAPFGSLNFSDISQYLVQYSSGNMDADLTNDGMLNFLDLSQYLSIYSDGCP